MPKKTKKLKGAGKVRSEGDEEQKDDQHLPQFGWINLKLVLSDPPVPDMDFDYVQEKMRTNQRIRDVTSKIAGFHGRVDKVQIFQTKPPRGYNQMEDPNPKIPEFSDQSVTLFEIFKTYGHEDKDEAPNFTLYYDFKPFNSTEPVLLALMIKGPNFKKTI